MQKFWLAVERWCPQGVGLAVAIIYFSVDTLRDHAWPETISQLLSAVVGVGGVAVGFLATAKSILVTIDERPIVQRIKAAGFYKRILTYLKSAIFWSFSLTILSAAALLFDYKDPPPPPLGGTPTPKVWTLPYAIGTAVWLGVAFAAVVSYVRIARIFYAMLDHLDAPAAVNPPATPQPAPNQPN